MEETTYKHKNFIFTKTNSFIYLLVAAIGVAIALIFYMRSQSQPKTTKEELEIQKIEKQSASDEVDDIEKDLENTELDSLDREITNIEAEFETSY